MPTNDTPHDGSPLSTQWTPPDPQLVRAAIERSLKRRPKRIYRTIVVKLHNPSQRKVDALLWAQRHVTNMTSHILEALRETPGQYRPDGAFACIAELYARRAQGTKVAPTVLLADILSQRFRGKHATPSGETTRPQIPPDLYPVSSTLRDGVFRQVAFILLTWYARVSKQAGPQENQDEENEHFQPDADLTEDANNEGVSQLFHRESITVPEAEQIHTQWTAQWEHYAAASASIVPFGRHRGQPLAANGKREVRWLKERLLSTNTIAETLRHIAVLRNANISKDADLGKARRARHPWRRLVKQQRRPRSGPMIERSFPGQAPLIRLSALDQTELEWLEADLLEMQQFAVEFAQLRDAVDLFLAPAPARYPTVASVPSQEQHAAAHEQHTRTLEALSTRIYSPEREAEVVSDLANAARTLNDPPLQPLNFKRSMIPGTIQAFALLYSVSELDHAQLEKRLRHLPLEQRQRKIAKALTRGESYQYVLAIVLHGRAVFRGPQAIERFIPTIRPGLYYVNYPDIPFELTTDTSVLLFPLEMGADYHEDTFLHNAIAEHRQLAQQRLETPVTDGKRERSNALISTLRITSRKTRDGSHAFYAHLPIPTALPAAPPIPDRVIGIHEHEHGYSYVLADFTGAILHSGHVPIPDHVRPEKGQRYSHNYAFEIANQIVALATANGTQWALIGLEKTDWRKQRVQLSRRVNRQRFAQPSAKIRAIIQYKSLLAGLPTIHQTWGVSLRRCSRCGAKNARREREQYKLTITCYACSGTNLVIDEARPEWLRCAACNADWMVFEPWFRCETCEHQQPARLNAATLVARQTLSQLSMIQKRKPNNRHTKS